MFLFLGGLFFIWQVPMPQYQSLSGCGYAAIDRKLPQPMECGRQCNGNPKKCVAHSV